MEDEVIDFINRRFTKECKWVNGNCYWFAYILKGRFPFLEIYYEFIEGHFYAVDAVNELAYDFRGKHKLTEKMICFNCLEQKDPTWYERIRRDCIS